MVPLMGRVAWVHTSYCTGATLDVAWVHTRMLHRCNLVRSHPRDYARLHRCNELTLVLLGQRPYTVAGESLAEPSPMSRLY
jgi:hypothetical protein